VNSDDENESDEHVDEDESQYVMDHVVDGDTGIGDLRECVVID